MSRRPHERHPNVPARRLAAALLVVAVVVVGVVLASRWADHRLDTAVCEFTAGDRSERFTPEQAANAATISMVAVERGLPPRAASIALATAIQESGLRNLTYGDADSLGLFQQRPSQGWGGPEEIRDPVYASGAFYDALERVPQWQSGVVTEVAQAVQRSAYPDAYADHETEGRVLASVLAGQTPAGIGCELEAGSGAGSAQEVLDKAESQFGATGRADGTQVVIDTASPARAWATAQWAVAHAQAEGITTVEVDGRRWSRDSAPLTWGTAESEEPRASVLITVGPG